MLALLALVYFQKIKLDKYILKKYGKYERIPSHKLIIHSNLNHQPIYHYSHNPTNNPAIYRSSSFFELKLMNLNILLAALVYLLGFGQSLKTVV